MKVSLWNENVPYATGSEGEVIPFMTYYSVEANERTPAVVICPGGGYSRKAEHEGEPIAQWLNGLGIAAFVLDYRVAPYKHPAPLSDVQRAIRTVRCRADEWNIDPQRIGILGFSAGGHLASTAGTHFDDGQEDALDPVERESCRPDAMVLCYPVISFGEYRHQGSMTNLIGEDADQDLRNYLSNEKQVTAQTPPTFLWHTADDGAVPVENSLMFASALSAHNVPFDLHVYESGMHGLGLAEEHPQAREWTGQCAVWLRKQWFKQA